MQRYLPILVTVLLASTAALAEGIETRRPNARGQVPVLADQTRAPLPAQRVVPDIEVVAEDLPQLWAMEFLPAGDMLVTAREGRLFVVRSDGTVGPDISGVPKVVSSGQGGLLDLALAPDFATSNRVYFSFSEPREGGSGTSVGRATLAWDGEGGGRLEDVAIIFRQVPAFRGSSHYGSRLVFDADGALFVTVGERSNAAVRVQAQDVASGLGKVFRIDGDGAALPDNPFVDTPGALPEIWSLGHRNMQSAALDGEGRLWTVEHGPRGGDELNMPEAGKNYGWPEVTYGIDYSGKPIGEGITARVGTEQPVYYWDPVIAPSGMAFYEGAMFPEWRGAFLVGGLVAQSVVVLHMADDRVVAEERIPAGARVRDVKVAPDGSVFAVTERRGGGSAILRLSRNDPRS
jgi:glucose/arabinose dehydrogenase